MAACSSNPPTPEANTPPPALEASPPPAIVIEVPNPEVVEPKITTITPAPEAIIVNDDPQQFLDLNIHELTRLLGVPSLVRRDGPAEVWQYQGDDCILDIFLYKSPENLQVKYIDLRGQDDNSVKRACFAEILRQHIQHMS